MKVAYFSEAPADEAAVRVLVEGLLGRQTVPAHPRLSQRAGGWPAVREFLPRVIKGLHYDSDADALVVVADSNNTLIDPGGPATGLATDEECRLVQLRREIDVTVARLRPVAGRAPLKIAVGLVVPAIEAWLLCGADPAVSEKAYTDGLRQGRLLYTKQELKRRAYGSRRTDEAMRTATSVEHAARLARDLASLERHFPYGFGALAEAIRKW